MKMYDVTLRCSVKALSDLLSVVNDVADLVAVKESLEQAPPAPEPESLTWRNNDGGMASNPEGRGKFKRRSRTDGVSGWQLLLETVSNPNRTYTMTEIKREFKAMGFSENSPTSLMYRAIKEGKIRNCGGSIYQRVAEPPKANGAA